MKFFKLLWLAKKADPSCVSHNNSINLAVHLSGNLITDEIKKKIRDFMHPRKRIKDMYDLINAPESDEDKQEIKIGNVDLAAAIKEKLHKYAVAEALEGNKAGEG